MKLFRHIENYATTLLVSHDINEVFKLSNYVYLIENGKINKQGKPNDVFNNTKINTKIQIEGVVLKIEENILTVMINNSVSKITISKEEAKSLQINDKIQLTSITFNPTV